MANIKIILLLALAAGVPCRSSGQEGPVGPAPAAHAPAAVQPLPNAHAHNDYEHERPLLDALANGFISVEADVYFADGRFYVYHDRPAAWDGGRTLENLYLRPLEKWIGEHEGRVYPGYDGFFYLMIDLKSNGNLAYGPLKQLLRTYEGILAVVRDGSDEPHKPVKVFLSGNRPVDDVLRDTAQIAALDGRPVDLDRGIPPALMPVVSDNYVRFLSWRGEGPVDPEERQRLRDLVRRAHAEGKKVRLWAAPDTPEGWAFLLENGVDLINTDRLPELRRFLAERRR